MGQSSINWACSACGVLRIKIAIFLNMSPAVKDFLVYAPQDLAEMVLTK